MMIRHWSNLSERPALPAGDCQLWLAWLDEEDPDSFRGFLSGDERKRAGRLRSPCSADRFTVARGILRALLGRYLASKPEQMVFSYGPHGKPGLADGLQAGLSFNVSHSGGLAVFAIANGFGVGVDIEEIHPVRDLEATASIFLSPDELAEFEALPAAGKLERFFTVWTCKEAILKAFGSGFTSPVRDILTTFCQPGPKGDGQNAIFGNKGLTLLNPAEGFKGALACLYPLFKE
ncbi:MAG TPA: 4'-phosphopantetheinyl transferase superfamily protein [Anaerolineales bacterium]